MRTIGSAFVAVVLLSLTMQPSDATTDAWRAPPDAPGTFIWVGNHRLHLNCIGQGSPTVIFESGLGGTSLDWVRVQPQVAEFTRACAYDRAGYGWSDSGPMPRDSVNISQELDVLLGNAGVPAPYLLVGHSFGGLTVRLYSYLNPRKVAGLVLVDSSHEDQYRRFEAAGVKASAPRGQSFFIGNAFQIPAALPNDVAPVARSFAESRRSMVALLSELRHIRNSARQIRSMRMLSNIPLVVISHRVHDSPETNARTRRDRLWLDMQAELARRSTRGRHIIAATNDHYVHLSEPQIVVDSIRFVIDQLN